MKRSTKASDRDEATPLWWITHGLAAVVLIAIAFFVTFPGFTSQVTAENVRTYVEGQSYSNVSVTATYRLGPAWIGCKEPKTIAFDVEATNLFGRREQLLMCCNWGWISEKTCHLSRTREGLL